MITAGAEAVAANFTAVPVMLMDRALLSAESLMVSESAPPEVLLTLTGPPMPASEPLPTTTLSLAVLLTVTALLEPQMSTVLLPTPYDCAPGLIVRGVLAAVSYTLKM